MGQSAMECPKWVTASTEAPQLCFVGDSFMIVETAPDSIDRHTARLGKQPHDLIGAAGSIYGNALLELDKIANAELVLGHAFSIARPQLKRAVRPGQIAAPAILDATLDDTAADLTFIRFGPRRAFRHAARKSALG